MKKIIELGKVDYNKSGRRNCMVELEISFDGERFTVCGGIWNPGKTNYYSCGQNVDEIARLFPHNKKVQRIHELWKRWHLNDMNAGSPAQRKWLKDNPISDRLNYYNAACAGLAKAGLNPDPNYIHNGQPYEYGKAWLMETIPADIAAEIWELMA